MPSTTPPDDALLARLNALKKSTVSLDTSYNASISSSNPKSAADPLNDLATRFARLGSASPSGSPKPSRTASLADTQRPSAPVIAPGAPSYLEGIAEGIGSGGAEGNPEDEKSLEELIGELGLDKREGWDVNKDEREDIGKLLKDIRTILPDVQKGMEEDRRQADTEKKGEGLTDWENVKVDIGSESIEVGNAESGEGEDTEKKKTEDEETDDIIARVMAELEISRKYDPPSPPSEEGSASGDRKEEEESKTQQPDGGDDNGFSLPSAPTSLPESSLDHTQAIEDVLAARLAALSSHSASQTDSLGLPSAPSFSPAKKPPKVQSSLAKGLDDEVDTWCVICTDDATLRCLGCDGDLYCQNCWMEGHKGESAGWEERQHKAVLYSKKKKQAAA
ncbi:hypothetical protein CC80DRAFT_272098 [Byssothecium circinans]|uniref:Uncharacterized protein n=1 Tax=Byssothecium circinans TaxID=147558 RepID=A0A6A5T8Z4_9PLEO|nr:hypothetical protein CC80DRAFT_272098 [Byssothecium circinans]